MRLKDFDYTLPKNLIAQKPVRPRDHSRLLILDRATGEIKHKYFYNIINCLKPGDVLVLNNTKVMRARLIGKKAATGGKIEVFLLRKIKTGTWQCLIGGKGRKEGLQVNFKGGLKGKIIKNNYDGTSASLGFARDKSLSAGTWDVKFNKSGPEFMKIVEKIGKVPLPPYIKRDSTRFAGASASLAESRRARRVAPLQNDKNSYQTVYADETKIGSVAAPTAGFHFTKQLINRLKKKGVQFEYVTLHVGLGTFAPVKTDDITKHKMHAEWMEVDKNTLKRIIKAKNEGRRVIAVGTTSVRTLESVFKNYSNICHCEERKRRSNLTYSKFDQRLLRCPEYGASRNDRNYSAWTDIFICPGYKFKAVDAMITNFHLPKSTLLMLVSAFAKPACRSGRATAEESALAGRNKIFKAYQAAVKKKYRFYSYGDAMLVI